MTSLDLSALDWTLLAVAALLVGFAKTAIGGVAALAVAVFAAVLPAKESTGALLPLLMVGDVLAVRAYRRHADVRLLLRLLPSVVVGVLAGAVFMAFADDTVMRRTIGAVLILIVVVHLATGQRSSRTADAEPPPAEEPHRALTTLYGTSAGATTMVANAGGPVMSLYLLSARLGKLAFLGTGAAFFATVNVVKVPFSVGLGLITGPSLLLCLVLAPAVLAGGGVGRLVIGRVDQALFERLVLIFTVVSALNLFR